MAYYHFHYWNHSRYFFRIFLISLNWVTKYRDLNQWLFYLLPLSGLVIGLFYHYLGKDVEKGNNQLIEEIVSPQKIIPWKMAPLVLVGTLLTHLTGGSAGREGTAVQMSGALADQLTRVFSFNASNRKTLLICAISAGFASVFGTPLAGTIFALEVCTIGKMRYDALLPALLAAIIADLVGKLWGAEHTHYAIQSSTEISVSTFFLAIAAGLVFAASGWLFTYSIHFFKKYFNYIKYPPLRPVIGGIILVIIFYFTNTERFAGLGIETVVESFASPQPWYFFIAKIALTAITLASGFKGGEVTPLFFVGATLGSALALVIPLPVDLLTAMGFVAAFAAAANKPIACVFMGIELFGSKHAVFFGVVCCIAFLFSREKESIHRSWLE